MQPTPPEADLLSKVVRLESEAAYAEALAELSRLIAAEPSPSSDLIALERRIARKEAQLQEALQEAAQSLAWGDSAAARRVMESLSAAEQHVPAAKEIIRSLDEACSVDCEAPEVRFRVFQDANSDAVKFTATVQDPSGGRSVTLHYRYSGENGYQARLMQPDRSGRFSTVLDPQGADLSGLRFYFKGVDGHGNFGYAGSPERPFRFDGVTQRNP